MTHPFLQHLAEHGLYDPPKPRLVATGPSAPAGDDGAKRYAVAALKGECTAVATAAQGTRNDTLNRAGFNLGQLVGAGHLSMDVASQQLTAAARANGLSDDEIARTVDRALTDGARSPRDVPEQERPSDATSFEAPTISPQDTPEGPRLWPASTLKRAAQPEWIARNRLPRSAISLLVGDEGIGKSLFWTWLTALITTGRACEDFGVPQRDPADVLVIVTEDDWSTTVRPRLEVAGADLERITVLCSDADGSGAPVFPRDMHVIHESDLAPSLIVVDAWLDTVSGAQQVRDPQQARQALHPWKEVAQSKNAAVLLLTHTNRTSTANARDKYGATGELRKKARMTLFAQADRDNEGQLLIGPEKANSAGKVDATRFSITAQRYFEATEDDDGCIPLLSSLGTSGQTMRKHLSDIHAEDTGEDVEEGTFAARWLREYLEQEGPEAESRELKREAVKAGIPERTLQRARRSLAVEISYAGSPPKTKWSLPGTTTSVQASA